MIVKDKGFGLVWLAPLLELVRADSTFTLEADPNAPPPAAYQQARPKLSRGATIGLAVGGAALLGTLMLALVKR